jgi:hypothetical protein
MSKLPPLTNETPLKPKFTTRDAYRLEALDKARSTVIEDLGEWVAEIPFDIFVAHLLPKIAGFDPSAAVEALKRAGALTCKQDNVWSWSAFESEPKYSELREPGAFKPLETVHGQICTESLFPGETSPPIASTNFFVCGDSTLTSEADVNRDPNTSRPDGYGYLKSDQKEFLKSKLEKYAASEGKDYWYNVVHVDEYKKEASLKDQDNVRKHMWSRRGANYLPSHRTLKRLFGACNT